MAYLVNFGKRDVCRCLSPVRCYCRSGKLLLQTFHEISGQIVKNFHEWHLLFETGKGWLGARAVVKGVKNTAGFEQARLAASV
jgi:hypothetical protein